MPTLLHTRGSSMRVSPRLPSRSVCVWALTLSLLLRSGCDARSCESARHPKVALLFLTRSDILHKDLWARWLSSAANLTDAAFAQNQLCTREHTRDCEADKQPSHTFGQRLFSLYIHSGAHKPADSKAAAAQPSDGFARFHIRSSITAEWGQPTLVMAERLLYQMALHDPDNQRFVLLSESCIPLYSPQLVYQQLIGELRSRVNACRNWRGTDDHLYRWDQVMREAEEEGAEGFVPKAEWRYSSQWKSLNRKHAELVASDYTVLPLFEERCRNNGKIECISDEHYIPTLLAHLGQEDEVDCLGYLTYNTWDPQKIAQMSFEIHKPVDFMPEFIDAPLIHSMRAAHCSSNRQLAMTRAAGMYIQGLQGLGENQEACNRHFGSYLNSSLQYSCHLFGRKFGAHAVEKVFDVIAGSACQELSILAPEQCRAPDSLL